jgi:hypothetical protein
MMFPTAAYLQASQNAAEMQMRGQEALGKGIASGINAVSSAFKEHKEEQAKFDATKKLFKAFSGSLDEDTKNSIESIFNDTSISTKEKNAISPAIMQYLGNVQQQKGREKIAEIMTTSREAIAADKNQPRPLPQFDATNAIDQFGLPAGSSPANPQALQPQPQVGGASDVPYMIQRQPDQPQPVQQQPRGKMPLTKYNEQTGEMEFWSPGARRYVPEPEGLYFNPKTLGLEPSGPR